MLLGELLAQFVQGGVSRGSHQCAELLLMAGQTWGRATGMRPGTELAGAAELLPELLHRAFAHLEAVGNIGLRLLLLLASVDDARTEIKRQGAGHSGIAHPQLSSPSSRRKSALDSRYRSYECEASAEDFLAAWQRANEEDKGDLETAFEFFPAACGARRIRQFLTAWDEPRVERMCETWFASGASLRPETTAFLLAFDQHDRAAGSPARRLVWEVPNVRVYFNGAAFAFEGDAEINPNPDAGETEDTARYRAYCQEYIRAHSRLERDALSLLFGYAPER